jgi:trehalose 6-phosphate phosphatase
LKPFAPPHIAQRIAHAARLWLFLDYDGTLASFAPTPDHVDTQPEIVELVTTLARHPRIRVAVVSGRRLSHVEKLVPVTEALLAGTYGVELRTFEGNKVNRVDKKAIRPVLEQIKTRWTELTEERHGFFLEDKGWALALHARFAGDAEAEGLLNKARRVAADMATPDLFRVLGGHKFLEVGPRLAHKGKTVAYLLDRYPWPDALPIYLGDDDKDEEAFGVVRERGGVAILVAATPRETQADHRLASPQAARQWLETLPAHMRAPSG